MEIGVRYESWKHMEVDFASTKDDAGELFSSEGRRFVPSLNL